MCIRDRAKVLDITEKLSFEGNPRLKSKGRELEVNADAPTMLKVMGLMLSLIHISAICPSE